jgi:hypothetical protein
LGWYDYGFRSYDAQIGRFPQLDPLTDDYPELTNYQYASCEPIANVDLDGLEKQIVTVAGKTTVTIRAPATAFISGATIAKQVSRVAVEVVKKPAVWSKLLNGAVWLGGRAALVLTLAFTNSDGGGWEGTTNEMAYRPGFAPIVAPVTNPLYNPPPVKGPQPPRKKQPRLHEQYVLEATEEGDFDVMERGQKLPQGTVHLKKGEVWKYGTTVNPERRYTQKWLREKKLKRVPQVKGTKEEVLVEEKIKIIKYRTTNGQLPPGNKQTN